MPPKERGNKPIRRFVPKTEPVVGDPYERVQITLQDLAHRIERVRLNYAQYRGRAALHVMSPSEKGERKERIRADIDILVEQCKGFARDRGVEAQFLEGLRHARRHYGEKKRRKRFYYYVTRTVSEVERFLEEHRLLLNVDPPPYSFVDDTWRLLIEDGERALAIEKHAKRAARKKGQTPAAQPAEPRSPIRDVAKIDSREVKDADDTER